MTYIITDVMDKLNLDDNNVYILIERWEIHGINLTI